MKSQMLICDVAYNYPTCFHFLVIESQNRANKDRLRNLQKARLVFQDHLGLEIRTIVDRTQLVKGKPSRIKTELDYQLLLVRKISINLPYMKRNKQPVTNINTSM